MLTNNKHCLPITLKLNSTRIKCALMYTSVNTLLLLLQQHSTQMSTS